MYKSITDDLSDRIIESIRNNNISDFELYLSESYLFKVSFELEDQILLFAMHAVVNRRLEVLKILFNSFPELVRYIVILKENRFDQACSDYLNEIYTIYLEVNSHYFKNTEKCIKHNSIDLSSFDLYSLKKSFDLIKYSINKNLSEPNFHINLVLKTSLSLVEPEDKIEYLNNIIALHMNLSLLIDMGIPNFPTQLCKNFIDYKLQEIVDYAENIFNNSYDKYITESEQMDYIKEEIFN